MSRIVLFSFLCFMLIAQTIPSAVQCSLVNQCAPLASCCIQISAPRSAVDEQHNCCAAPGCKEADFDVADSASDCCEPFQQQLQAWTIAQNNASTPASLIVSNTFIIQPLVFQSPININQDDDEVLHNAIRIKPTTQMPSTAALRSARCVRLLI